MAPKQHLNWGPGDREQESPCSPVVVIIDDRTTNRAILKQLASGLANSVLVVDFADPCDALAHVRRHIPDFVITDFNMPSMNGAEFIRRFRAEPGCDDIPVMVVTAYEDRNFRYAALESGATDFLLSPIDHREFVVRARNLLKLRQQQQIIEARAELLAQQLVSTSFEHELAMRESADKLRAVIDAVPAMISATDREGQLVFVNSCLAAAAGIQAEEAEGSSVAQLFGAGYGEASRLLDRQIFATGRNPHLFEETISNARGEERTLLTIKSPLRDRDDRVLNVVTASIDITDRKRAEERQRLLMAELDHRVKNTLAVVQSVAWQSLGQSEQANSFVGRLRALATAHGLLSQSQWKGASLKALIETELKAYRDAGRIAVGGPDLLLDPRAAQTLSLIVHELATNAAKYGALSVCGGRVKVIWRLNANDGCRLILDWIEEDGPPVEAPSRMGFGTRLIEQSVAYELDGTARLDFQPGGLRCAIDLPLPGAPVQNGVAGPVSHALAPPRKLNGLEGRRVLLVEDTALVAMELEDLLKKSGAEVVGPTPRLGRALAVAKRKVLDAAVLDVNLDGEMVFPVAEALRQRGVPFLFLTGYGEVTDWPAEFQKERRLTKPVQPSELLAALALMMPGGSAAPTGED